MTRRNSYFAAAALGAVAALVFLILNQDEDLATPVVLFAAWTSIMLVLGLRQPA
jgi:uncharacterized membrane protein YhhN